ncbi:MAG: MFS transporter [Xylophilus ampelinus]
MPNAAPTHTFADLVGQRSFMRLWLSRVAGNTGTQMLMVAVGWQMYDLTGSAWDLGLVGLYQFLPALLLSLVAGHVTDRHHRGRILAGCMVVQGLVAFSLLVATEGHWASRGLLLGLSVLLGCARAFQMPAQQAIVPLLVPSALLPRAMAFSSAGGQAATIGGPALGGLIFVAGTVAVYATCALLFVAACACVYGVRYEHMPRPKEPVTLSTLFAGVRFIWEKKPVLGAISLDLFAVLLGGAVALLPIYAKDILHTGPWGLGILRAAPAVGALAMSVVLTRWSLERKVGARMLAAVVVFGVAILVFGLSRSLWLSVAALAVSGAADMVSVVVRQTLVQLDTPDEMRGRVSAVNSVFIGASNQLGEFESGATAALMGPVGAVVFGGVGTIVVALLWFRLFPSLAQRDRMMQR